MDAALAAALRAIEEAEKQARQPGPVELSQEYLRWVAHIESLPQNRSGADKSWVSAAITDFESHYARARRIR